MADGGGIYTLSRQPGTLIAENYVHDIARTSFHGSYEINGIYLDEGSNLITVRDNVLSNTGDGPIRLNAAGPNNTFSNNDGFSSAIIANAGLEPAYWDIRQSGGLPPLPLPSPPGDTTAPVIALTAPGDGSTVSGTVSVTATASDAGGVVGVQFFLNGAALGAEDTTAPYAISWNSTSVANGGPYELSAQARDAANNRTSAVVNVTVSNAMQGAGLVAAYNFNEGVRQHGDGSDRIGAHRHDCGRDVDDAGTIRRRADV